MDVEVPSVLRKPLAFPRKTLMGAGPSNCSPRVLHALSHPILGHMHPECFQIMDDIKDGLKYVFQTKNDLTLAVSASGHGGMEAVLCNLIEPGDKVLIGSHGIWGERAADIAERYGANVTILRAIIGNDFSLAVVEHAISSLKPKIFFVVQGDSSTGVYQSLEGFGDICHKHNCLLVVDTVASLGGVPVYVDRWGIDAVYSGSQKVLGAPPGLAPISFSPRAQKVIFNRKTPIKVFYWDMKIVGQQWQCFGDSKPRPYHHTVSSTLLCGLREGLALIAEEGLENVISRHKRCSLQLYEGLSRIGLQPMVEEVHKRLPTVTTITLPDDVDAGTLTSYAMKQYYVEIAGGLGPTAGKVLRIGLMGYNATPEKVDNTLRILEESLKHARSKNNSKL